MTTPSEDRLILVVDSGGTGMRALLFDAKGAIVHREFEPVAPVHPEPGATEYDPEALFGALVAVIRRTLAKRISGASQVEAERRIAAMGVTNQRASFCLWDRDTGKPLTNVISWQDVRAADTADRMNRSFLWRALKIASFIIRVVTKSAFFTATSMLRITTDHDTCRLRWLFDARPELERLARDGRVMFGTLDTWFIYRLTGGTVHATDHTNAASTGLFNPFGLTWNRIFCSMFSIPMRMLPEVRDTNGDYGSTDETIIGARLPIRAAVGDQQAALFGHRCFDRGDTKISKGSGAFVDINVGERAKLSRRGLFPMVAWVLDGKPTYMLEGFVATAGTLIDWLGKGMGISETPKAIEEFALQCDDSEGVVFIPTPTGIRFPHFNPRMKASVVGLGLTTHRSHLARAVLEGIAFRVVDIIDGIRKDTAVAVTSLRVDGGLSRSNVLMQCLADFANVTVDRSPEPELTARGAAYLAGIGAGVFDLDSLRRLEPAYDRFEPHMEASKRKAKIERYRRAVQAILRID